MQSTIVLVHGAFADSSSWNDVAQRLTAEGHPVIAYANPLRTIAGDASGLTELVRTIDGPVVLVGHSYGGAVITNVPADAGDIVGLVYVAAFALEADESPAQAANSVPGSTLGDALELVVLPGGGCDAYIAQGTFHAQFCADLPQAQANLMAVTQRPIAEPALGEASGPSPLWKQVPSWFIFGDQDRNIPVAAQRAMADRANSKRTIEIAGASHVAGMSHPAETAQLIGEAAASSQP
jgi:pimeloyl-ACP methyl ester carboxylesterase